MTSRAYNGTMGTAHSLVTSVIDTMMLAVSQASRAGSVCRLLPDDLARLGRDQSGLSDTPQKHRHKNAGTRGIVSFQSGFCAFVAATHSYGGLEHGLLTHFTIGAGKA